MAGTSQDKPGHDDAEKSMPASQRGLTGISDSIVQQPRGRTPAFP